MTRRIPCKRLRIISKTAPVDYLDQHKRRLKDMRENDTSTKHKTRAGGGNNYLVAEGLGIGAYV